MTSSARAFLRVAAFLLAFAGRAEDWPQWRGPLRDGAWHEDVRLGSSAPANLKIAWRARVGPGWSSPVVAKGYVYVTDVEIARHKAKERVLCFKADNGKLRWRHEYAVRYPNWAFDPAVGGPRATPIVHGGRLYTLGCLGDLFCLDAVTGRVLWKKGLAAEYGVKDFSGITASPLIENDLLILFICGQPEACVIALDRNSGKEAWKALDDSFTYSSPLVINESGQRQLIIWTQEAVTSLNPATGQTWWRQVVPTPGDQAVSTPVFANHRLLVGGLMLQLDTNKPAASVLWPQEPAASKRVLSNTSTALLQDDCVFSGRTSGEFVCLEAVTGRELWRTNSVTGLGNGSSIHLTPCGNTVFLFTDEGNLIRAELTAAGYRELGRAQLLEPTSPFGGKKRSWTPPAYANGRVFARNDKELVCASLIAKP